MNGGAERKKADARRAEIVRAAQSLLADQGPSALTLRSVADAVGIKLASLQYHFRTYADLVEALADETVALYARGLSSDDEATEDSAQERLDRALRWFTVDAPGDRRHAKLEVQFWALAQTNADAKAALERYHATYLGLLARLIRAALPELSNRQARARALSIASLLEGSILFVDLAESPRAARQGTREVYASARTLAFAEPD